jgi:hypothetical protein
MSHHQPQHQRKTPALAGVSVIGAPGIEAGHPVTTMSYYGLLCPTTPAGFQGFPGFGFYSVLLNPPTYEPPTSHPYKCPSGQP